MCKATDYKAPPIVDFAGSDSLLKDAEYDAYPDLQMYPTVAAAVVPIYNLPTLTADDSLADPRVGYPRPFICPRRLAERSPYCCSPRGDGTFSLSCLSLPDQVLYPSTVSKIFRAHIRRWDDPEIVHLNPVRPPPPRPSQTSSTPRTLPLPRLPRAFVPRAHRASTPPASCPPSQSRSACGRTNLARRRFGRNL